MVLTDGEMTTVDRSFGNLTALSSQLGSKGIKVYALGVGKHFSRSELEEIASKKENVYTAASFEDLQGLSDRLTKGFCEGEYL